MVCIDEQMLLANILANKQDGTTLVCEFSVQTRYICTPLVARNKLT